jgi:hypothetical protein
MRFIKIGTLVINLDHVVCAEILLDKNRVRIELANNTSQSDKTLRIFQGSEAEALIEFLSDPNRTQDLCPSSPEVAGFQLYRERGGQMTFEDYGVALRRQQRLCAIESPSEKQLAQCSELEAKLLL